jgi:hypothetical protein
MADSIWLVVDKIWCDRAQAEADLLEERVYASEIVPNVEAPYRVRARKCSFGLECNLAGFTCRYAFNNPNSDPFA